MTTTTKLPATDAMTANDVLTSIRDLAKRVGTKTAMVSVVISESTFSDAAPIYLSIRPDGYASGSRPHTVNGNSWSEAFEAARRWIEQSKTVRRDTTIRKMALAIIELTDEHTECTAAMLKRREFSDEQIVEFHVAACVRAGEMCSGAPFRVVFETPILEAAE